MHAATIRGRLLLLSLSSRCSYYSRCGFYSNKYGIILYLHPTHCWPAYTIQIVTIDKKNWPQSPCDLKMVILRYEHHHCFSEHHKKNNRLQMKVHTAIIADWMQFCCQYTNCMTLICFIISTHDKYASEVSEESFWTKLDKSQWDIHEKEAQK